MRGTSTSYYIALNRHLLIMGVERKLFFLIMALTSSIAFTALFRPLMLFLSICVFLLGLIIGRLLTRSDHQFFSVYQRHLHYDKYYEPLASIQAPIISCLNSVSSISGGRKH